MVRFEVNEVFHCANEQELKQIALKKHYLKNNISVILELSEEEGFERFQEQTRKLAMHSDPPKDY